MRTFAVVALSLLPMVAAYVIGTSAAEARVVCREGYRIAGGEEIASPFCEDAYLAQVAREYGTKVTDREVQTNRLKRAEVCRFIGHDTRVRELCPDRGYRLF
jgi:hypothetical protein